VPHETATRSFLIAFITAAPLALTAINQALACACCTNPGQRNVGVAKLDTYKQAQIDELRFAAAAQLFVGEAEPNDVKGIATPSEHYTLDAGRQKDRLVFALRDEAGHSGTLSLQRPSTVSVFEVDPRDDAREGGNGPGLYKEWKLTAKAAGSGVFSPGLGPSQLLSLIVQGRGNSCTSSSDFTHWTLVMQGPKANYTLFGKLVTTP
jgi:hypothetical protein